MSCACLYFKARIERKKVVLFAALFRSMADHCAFDRANNEQKDTFEFYVPQGYDLLFQKIMHTLHQESLIISWWQEPLPLFSNHISHE